MIDNRPMRVESAVLRHVEMPLKFRFRTSFGETTRQEVPPPRARSARASPGWGECVAEEGPFYSPETLGTAGHDPPAFLLPLVLGKDVASPEAFDAPRGARAREPDGEGGRRDGAPRPLRAGGGRPPRRRRSAGRGRRSRSASRSGSRRPSAETVENVRKHVAQGYRRIKLKIEPGTRRRTALAAVREALPGHHAHRRRERGLHAGRRGHAALSRRVRPRLHRAAAPPRGPRRPRGAREDAEDADLPRRVDPLGGRRAGGDRARRVPGHQRQDRPRRRPRRGAADPRRRARGGRPALVRRDARGRRRARAQRRDREPPGLLEAGRHVVVVALLRGGHRGAARSRRRTACMPVPTGPGIGVAVRRDVLARVTTAIAGASRVSARVARARRALFDARRVDALATSRRSSCARARPTTPRPRHRARALDRRAARARRGSRPRACPCEGRGDAVLVRLGAERGGTLLLGHLDTVWPAGTLAEIPFRVEDGVARGPGVFDMKGGHRGRARGPRGRRRAGDVKPGGRRLAPPDAGRGGRERRLARAPRRRGAAARPRPRPRAVGRRRRREGRAQGDRPRDGALPGRGGARGPRAGEGGLGAPRDGALRPLRRRPRRPPRRARRSSRPSPRRARRRTSCPRAPSSRSTSASGPQAEGERVVARPRARTGPPIRASRSRWTAASNRPPMEPTEASLALYRRAAALAQTPRFRAAGRARRRRLRRKPDGGRRRPDARRPRPVGRRRARAHGAPPRRRPAAPRGASRGASSRRSRRERPRS